MLVSANAHPGTRGPWKTVEKTRGEKSLPQPIFIYLSLGLYSPFINGSDLPSRGRVNRDACGLIHVTADSSMAVDKGTGIEQSAQSRSIPAATRGRVARKARKTSVLRNYRGRGVR